MSASRPAAGAPRKRRVAPKPAATAPDAPSEDGIPLDVWCFVGADDLWAITLDEQGANLPPAYGPWRFLRTARLDGGDADQRDAARLVAAHGYCCYRPGGADGPFLPRVTRARSRRGAPA